MIMYCKYPGTRNVLCRCGPNAPNVSYLLQLCCSLLVFQLSCIYNDHSLYMWDLRNIKHIGKLHSFLYHNACVWDVDVSRSNGCGKGVSVCVTMLVVQHAGQPWSIRAYTPSKLFCNLLFWLYHPLLVSGFQPASTVEECLFQGDCDTRRLFILDPCVNSSVVCVYNVYTVHTCILYIYVRMSVSLTYVYLWVYVHTHICIILCIYTYIMHM